MKRISSSFKVRKITTKKTSRYLQDARNCRLYASLNNLRNNTHISTDVEDFKLYIRDKKIQTQYSNSAYIACEYLVKYNEWIEHYAFNALENTYLLKKLLINGYTVICSRWNNQEFYVDVLKDDILNSVPPSKWDRHVVNEGWENLKVTEYGTWWEYNALNKFTFNSMQLFIDCIKAGRIDPVVRFLDFKQ